MNRQCELSERSIPELGFFCVSVCCVCVHFTLLCVRVRETECESVDGGRFERACFLCTDKPLS